MDDRARYRDRPDHASDGSDFAELCMDLLRTMLHENPHPCRDKKSQIEIGDTFEGDEFKHLQKSYRRLHIEISERSNRESPWVPSGIYCNRVRYICGKEDDIFGFAPQTLREWRERNSPALVWHGGKIQYYDAETGFKMGTIQSFVLPKDQAASLAIFRFRLIDGSWRLFCGEPCRRGAVIRPLVTHKCFT